MISRPDEMSMKMELTKMQQTSEWLLWQSLHFLFTIMCVISSAFSRAGKLLSAARLGDSRGEGKGKELEDKPVAVAVVFANLEGVDWESKVCQLIFWLSAINVTHVTLFDPAGALKRSQLQLQKTLNILGSKDQQVHCYPDREAPEASHYLREVQNIKRQVVEDERFHEELCTLRRRKGESLNADQTTSELTEMSHMKVELLSLQDGKESLVRAARNVCENAYKLHYAKHHQMKIPKLTEEDVTSTLQRNGPEGPDPDLLLLFGKTRSLHGFPPWRLRLTEIVHMGSLQEMSANSLVAALKEFAKKTHRYGR